MESLINYQEDVASRIMKAEVNYKKTPKIRLTKEYVQGRLELLERLWCDFMTGHKELLQTADSATLKDTRYSKTDVYGLHEEIYFGYKCELRTALNSFVVPETHKPKDRSCETHHYSHVKLPKFTVPSFSGKYTEWTTFRDLFVSAIHNNTTLDNVQKLHYLKSFVTGEAEQLLRNVPITEANYDRCWKQLESRYNNKKYLSHCVLKRFLSQKNASSESATFLKELLDTSTDCLCALSNIGINVETWDIIVIHILSLKLDPETRKQWELCVTNVNSGDELPTFTQFKDFLQNRYRALEFVDMKPVTRNIVNIPSNAPKPKSLHVTTMKCTYCADDHKITNCKKFISVDSDTRRDFVQTSGLCFNCLGSNHSAKVCQHPNSCRVCNRRHHSLLHSQGTSKGTPVSGAFHQQAKASTDHGTVVSSNTAIVHEDKETSVVACLSSGKNNKQVLLATAVMKVESKTGKYYALRALLDQGSQASFVTESMVQFLGLKKTPVKGHISGLGGSKNMSNFMVNLKLIPTFDSSQVVWVKAYVLKAITTFLPSEEVVELDWLDVSEVRLADPQYHTPNKIDLLLGAEIYSQILQDGVRKDPHGTILAQSTVFGWVLSGLATSSKKAMTNLVTMHTVVDENEILKQFWEESDVSNPKEMMTEEEKRCEEIYAETTTRDSDGIYVVKLPFRDENPACLEGNSRHLTEKCFHSLERNLQKESKLKEEFKNIFKEYLDLNHMEKVPKEEQKNENQALYLPYHAVIREDKDTTKFLSAVNLGALAAGVCVAWSSSALPVISKQITEAEASWGASLLCLGALFGAVPSGLISEHFGRKKTLLYLALPLVVSWILVTSSPNVYGLYVGRFIGGVAVGAFSVSIPPYVEDIAEKCLLPSLVNFYHLYFTCGILFGYIIGMIESRTWFCILCSSLPTAFFIAFIFLPESPAYLISQGKVLEAKTALRYFRGIDNDIDSEIVLLKEYTRNYAKNRVTFKQLFSTRATLKALVVSFGLMIFQQMSGIYPVLFYAENIFETFPISLNPPGAAIILGFCLVSSTYFSTLLLKKIRRRVLLILSLILMALNLGTLAIYYHLRASNIALSNTWVPLFTLCMFVSMYAISVGPIPWLMLREIFPPNVTRRATAITAGFHWFLAFAVTKLYQNLVTKLKPGWTLWHFAVTCVIGALFVYFFVPETKDRTLQEIQDEFHGIHKKKKHTHMIEVELVSE